LLGTLNGKNFPAKTEAVTGADIASRLRQYEHAIDATAQLTILLAAWGTEEYQPLLAKIVARLAENNEPRSGNHIWNELRWYPITVLLYCGGIVGVTSFL